jgi:hypothetical protein
LANKGFLKGLKGGRALVKKPLQTQDFLFSKNIMEREYPIVCIGALY